MVYCWGYGGYCRMGMQHQNDIMTPKIVPRVSGPLVLFSLNIYSCLLSLHQFANANPAMRAKFVSVRLRLLRFVLSSPR